MKSFFCPICGERNPVMFMCDLPEYNLRCAKCSVDTIIKIE